MTRRTDDLTDRLLGGTLTDAEAAELGALLAGDPAALGRHLALLEVEAALRGLRTDPHLGPAVVARIEADRAAAAARGVLAALARRPAPPWVVRRRIRRRIVAAGVTVAAAVALAVWLLPTAAPAPAPPFARLADVTGAIEVAGDDGRFLPAESDFTLAPGQTVRSVGDDSTAVVEFADRTRVAIHPDTAVRLSDGERRLFLVEGRVTADLPDAAEPPPMVFGTGAGDVVARSGHVDVWSADPDTARVEVRDGSADVVRGGGPVRLGPRLAAFVPADAGLMAVEAAFEPQSIPLHRLDFPGATDVAFPPGGGVWAASASRFVRWTPGAAEPPAWTPFGRGYANDGVVGRFAGGLAALVCCRVDDRETLTTVRELPGTAIRHRLPVRVSEARFLAVSPAADWIATVAPKPDDRRVRVWDAAAGKVRSIAEFPVGVTALAGSPDGRALAVGLSDLGRGTHNGVALIDPASGRQTARLSTARGNVAALAYSGDGRLLAAGFPGRVQVWDLTTHTLVRTIDGFEQVITRLAFSSDGGRLAAGTGGGRVWVWHAHTGRRAAVYDAGYRAVRGLAFRPDGRAIATATNQAGVAVWQLPAPMADGSDL